jgi:phosphoglycolate phosphatase-like HAD superfamily hydrolase
MEVAMKRALLAVFAFFFITGIGAAAAALDGDPLPSWNDGAVKQSIIAFVEKVTEEGSPEFVPPVERIAVFDNDGTLWSERPLYFQLVYAFDRVKELAPRHPEWSEQEPFAAILRGDAGKALEGGEHAILEIVAASHAGVTADEFASSVAAWLRTARHPKTKRAYNEMVYQPMLELLDYLRANGFKTFIVSGGGIDFMRVFAEGTYGIPPEQVVGSSIVARYEVRDGIPVIVKIPELNFLDDKEGKPVGIHQHIGRRPIFAAGNSDGDFQMLEWTTMAPGAGFGLLVHHTDADREWAYDRGSKIGRLERGLDEAPKRGWTIVDMKRDWKVVYPFDAK